MSSSRKENELEELSTIAVRGAEPLTSSEVETRRNKYGPNTIVTGKRIGVHMILLQALFHPFNVLLVIIAVSSAVADEVTTTIVISVMVIISTSLRFYQEWKSESAVHGLLKLITKSVTVIRIDSLQVTPREITVRSEELVPGDLVVLRPGEVVPADAEILTSKVFFVSQAPLTGEALPVEKYKLDDQVSMSSRAKAEEKKIDDERQKRVALHKPMSRPKRFFRVIFGMKVTTESQLDKDGYELKEDLSCPHHVFMGSQVISGLATAQVLRTGHYTLFGRMAAALSKEQSVNPFQRGVKRISWIFFITMALMVPPVFLLRLYSRDEQDWKSAFIFSLAVAVGLTPEMLPMIVNANLAKGSVEMSKKSSILKNLDAIINLGAVDVLCTDKTGTLTKSVVQLAAYINPYGDLSLAPLQIGFLNSYFQSILQNPLDSAITAYFDMMHGFESDLTTAPEVSSRSSLIPSNTSTLVRRFSRVDELPFDFIRRRLSVILSEKGQSGQRENIYIVCKGAVEETMSICTKAMSPSVNMTNLSNEHVFPLDKETVPLNEALISEIKLRCSKRTELGERLLAVAYKSLPQKTTSAKSEDESDLILVGFLSFVDPPKESAKTAVVKLREHNIELKVLTGDAPNICSFICNEISLPVKSVVTAEDVSKAEIDGTLNELVENGTVFARLSPLEKLLIVKTLKDNNHVVGFLGDGINDAPSLREADVGISVSESVDICRESANIILLDKDLNVVVDGVRIGRKTYVNTIKYIAMAVSSNFGNVFSVLVASIFLPYEPMHSLQLLIQNLLYDCSQIAIPWDRVDEELLLYPHKWRMRSILRFMVWMGPWSSVFDIATFVFMYNYYEIYDDQDTEKVKLFQTTWFTVGLLTQTLIVHMIRTAKIPIFQSRASLSLTCLTLIVMAIGLALPYIPTINDRLEFYENMQDYPVIYYFLAAVLLAYSIAANVAKFIYIKIFHEWF